MELLFVIIIYMTMLKSSCQNYYTNIYLQIG
jgi:hypothetical protein